MVRALLIRVYDNLQNILKWGKCCEACMLYAYIIQGALSNKYIVHSTLELESNTSSRSTHLELESNTSSRSTHMINLLVP